MHSQSVSGPRVTTLAPRPRLQRATTGRWHPAASSLREEREQHLTKKWFSRKKPKKKLHSLWGWIRVHFRVHARESSARSSAIIVWFGLPARSSAIIVWFGHRRSHRSRVRGALTLSVRPCPPSCAAPVAGDQGRSCGERGRSRSRGAIGMDVCMHACMLACKIHHSREKRVVFPQN